MTTLSMDDQAVFSYYIRLAVRSFKSSPAVTVLLIFVMSFGIGSTVVAYSIFHSLTADPLPGRSQSLYYVRMDLTPSSYQKKGRDPADSMTYRDAKYLLGLDDGHAKFASASTTGIVYTDDVTRPYREAHGHFVTSDFFRLAGLSVVKGDVWSRETDEGAANVIVVTDSFSKLLFGSDPPLGKNIYIAEKQFRVIGVVKDDLPYPSFYSDTDTPAFRLVDQYFIPMSAALSQGLPTTSNVSCWGDELAEFPLQSDQCTWVQFWVHLPVGEEKEKYEHALSAYVDQRLGHDAGKINDGIKLYDLMGWLKERGIVSGAVKTQVVIAFAFLAICIVNCSGLMLTRSLRRAREIYIRRALGASRKDILYQVGMEAVIICFAGGVFGTAAAVLFQTMVDHGVSVDASVINVGFDANVYVYSMICSILAGLTMGLIPAIKLSRTSAAA
ncbi:MAG: ABC transporter permease [Pseudoxanthomonas sp.]